MNVTLVTRDATLDDLSVADYREIFDELKQGHSYGQLVTLIGSAYSRALWQQYDAGERQLSRGMRNELRKAIGKPELPPTVAEATAAASPDAAVWQVGEGVPEHVIMVAEMPVTLHVNGAVTKTGQVTGVTSPATKRKSHKRLWVPDRLLERYTGLRTAYSDADIIEAGIKTLEVMP